MFSMRRPAAGQARLPQPILRSARPSDGGPVRVVGIARQSPAKGGTAKGLLQASPKPQKFKHIIGFGLVPVGNSPGSVLSIGTEGSIERPTVYG